jgi:hypothetical protein
MNGEGLGLWCLMPLSTMFQLYCGCQFYWWRKPEYQEKTTNLPQLAVKKSNASAMSWQEHVTFNEMMMMSALY